MLLTLARPSEKGKECFVVIKCALVICGAGGDALKDAGVGDSELSSGRLKKRFQTAFVCRAYDYALFLTKLIVPTLVVCRFVFDMENKWMPSEKRFQTAFVCRAYDYALFSQSQSYLRLLFAVSFLIWKINGCRLKKGFRRHLFVVRAITLCF